MRTALISLALAAAWAWAAGAARPPVGFQEAVWGMSQAEVRGAVDPSQWRTVPAENDFPEELGIKVFGSNETIAGYPAEVRYYFVEDRFCQATVDFDFSHLASYDFNYNVFRSVDEYYRVIRDETLTFVHDIFDLLRKKYGKKEPVFEGLDPREVFLRTDERVRRDRWNFRYHPSEYYKNIIASSYARWDFPKTRVLFSVNISAADKRFDYRLSLTSLDLQEYITTRKDRLRSQDL
jgi:hypothetical protein